jgi:ketosteroid isomerase-like protein
MIKESYTNKEKKVLDVFDRHLAAFAAGDIEAVVADFREDSVLVTPQGVFTGTDGARHVFSGLIAEFGSISRGDSPGFTFDAKHVHGDTLFITWHAESKYAVFPFGTDTFICDGEKILRQSIAFSTPMPRRPA